MQVLSSLSRGMGHGFKDLDEVIELQMQAGLSERLSSLGCPGTRVPHCAMWVMVAPRNARPAAGSGAEHRGTSAAALVKVKHVLEL